MSQRPPDDMLHASIGAAGARVVFVSVTRRYPLLLMLDF